MLDNIEDIATYKTPLVFESNTRGVSSKEITNCNNKKHLSGLINKNKLI